MSTRVGPKGQVVIEKWIRDRLGIEPRWLAIQRLVDDHVEIRFIRGEHDESLAGILAPHLKRRIADEEWHDITEAAWDAHVRERHGRRPDEHEDE